MASGKNGSRKLDKSTEKLVLRSRDNKMTIHEHNSASSQKNQLVSSNGQRRQAHALARHVPALNQTICFHINKIPSHSLDKSENKFGRSEHKKNSNEHKKNSNEHRKDSHDSGFAHKKEGILQADLSRQANKRRKMAMTETILRLKLCEEDIKKSK